MFGERLKVATWENGQEEHAFIVIQKYPFLVDTKSSVGIVSTHVLIIYLYTTSVIQLSAPILDSSQAYN